MTSKQQETFDQITKARAKERPELSHPITATEEGKNVIVHQGSLPVVRIGPGGGIYLPESKSFANSTPQVDPTPLEAATFPDKYTLEAPKQEPQEVAPSAPKPKGKKHGKKEKTH